MHESMQQHLVSRWEHWRELIGGAPAGRQRREVQRRLRTQPVLLFWGDCWFSSPFCLNLARQAALRMDGIAMVIGKPVAGVDELFTPANIRAVVTRLRSNPFDLLCLSAGGLDGWASKLAQLFKPWASERKRARLDARGAFERVLEARLFERIHARYSSLLEALAPLKRERPAFAVLGHSYAVPLRIGQAGELKTARLGLLAALAADPGPWLWKALQHALPDKLEARQLLALLLTEGLRDGVLQRLQQEFAGLFAFADFSAQPELKLERAWYDEIHPEESAFAAMAVSYTARLRELLPAAKRGAVR